MRKIKEMIENRMRYTADGAFKYWGLFDAYVISCAFLGEKINKNSEWLRRKSLNFDISSELGEYYGVIGEALGKLSVIEKKLEAEKPTKIRGSFGVFE